MRKKILKKAIKKAEKYGYIFPFSDYVLEANDLIFGKYRWVPSIIFSHDFAKAFWGEEEKEIVVTSEMTKSLDQEYKTGIKMPLWKFHLQNMVLYQEPLKYLEKFLGAK